MNDFRREDKGTTPPGGFQRNSGKIRGVQYVPNFLAASYIATTFSVGELD